MKSRINFTTIVLLCTNLNFDSLLMKKMNMPELISVAFLKDFQRNPFEFFAEMTDQNIANFFRWD